MSKVLLAGICFVLLTASASISFRAPVGSWPSTIYGFAVANNDDPDGLYLPSAIQYNDQKSFPFYLGTPGVTLHFALLYLTKAYHFFSGSDLEYVDFCAKNWMWVNILARLFCATVFVALLPLIFLVCREMGLGDFESALAAMLYGLSYPVLIYLNKISPEGLMMLFAVSGIYCLLRYEKVLKVRYLVGSAVFCGLALCTKVHYLFFLPFLMSAYLLGRGGGRGVALRLGCFWLTLSVVLLWGACFIEINKWTAGWREFINNFAYHGTSQENWHRFDIFKPWTVFGVVFNRVVGYLESLGDLVLFRIPKGEDYLFFSASVFLYVFGLAGVFRRLMLDKITLFWIAAMLLSLPMLFFRLDYHYYYFINLPICIYAARYLADLTSRSGGKAGCVLLAIMLSWPSVHLFSVKSSNDIQTFVTQVRPFYEALDQVAHGQRVGVLRREASDDVYRVGGFFMAFGIDHELRLLRKFREQFVVIDDCSEKTIYQNFVFAILDFNNTGHAIRPAQ